MTKSEMIKKYAADLGIEIVELKVKRVSKNNVMGLPKVTKTAPKMVERRNAMTGAKFMEEENVPFACSPRSETYWCS